MCGWVQYMCTYLVFTTNWCSSFLRHLFPFVLLQRKFFFFPLTFSFWLSGISEHMSMPNYKYPLAWGFYCKDSHWDRSFSSSPPLRLLLEATANPCWKYKVYSINSLYSSPIQGCTSLPLLHHGWSALLSPFSCHLAVQFAWDNDRRWKYCYA